MKKRTEAVTNIREVMALGKGLFNSKKIGLNIWLTGFAFGRKVPQHEFFMDTLLTAKLRITEKAGKTSRVTAVAAYEDTATGARAEDFCQSLVRHLGSKCEFIRQMWPLSELRLPQLRAIAAGEASRADLVIISVHHSEQLPADLANWVEEWAHRKDRRVSVLLGLFDPVYQGVSASIRAYLAEVARKAEIEFLTQSEETAAEP